MNAVCSRCGALRVDYRYACPACGHRPVGEGLLVAWLLSSENLSLQQLHAASERIAAGEVIRPSAAQLAKARARLGQTFASDAGLTTGQQLALLACGLLLTPLPAWVVWVWWFRCRPRAAWQAFALAVPGSVLYLGLGGYWVTS